MGNKNQNNGRRRRIIRRVLYIASAIFAAGFLLFSIFIFNPLEPDYKGSLLALLPASSEVVYYVPSCSRLHEKLCNFLPWKRIIRTSAYREFIASPFRQELFDSLGIHEFILAQEQLKEDFGWDFLDWEYLSEIVGKEAVYALRPADDRVHSNFLFITRITWKCKLVDGLLPYLVSGETEGEFQLDFKGSVRVASTPHGRKIYWMRHRDVEFFSDDESFIRESLAMLENQPGMTELTKLRKDFALLQGDILFYIKKDGNESPDFWEEGDFLPDVVCYTGAIYLEKPLLISLSADLRHTERQGRYRRLQWNLTPYLPKNTFLYAKFAIDPGEFWPQFQEYWSPDLREDILPYLTELNEHYGKEDFIADCCGKYLKEEAALTLSTTDFVKEGVRIPFEQYPAVSLIFKTPHACEFFKTLEEAMEILRQAIIAEEFDSDTKFTFFEKETHGSHPYIRLKYPDTSGGAVKPAIGAWRDYLIFTSHAAFLKEFFDIVDGFGIPVEESASYPAPVRNMWDEECNLHLSVDPDGAIAAMQNIEKQCLKWYIEDVPPQEVHQREREFRLILECVRHSQIFKFGFGMVFDISREEIHGKIVVPVEMRK